MEFFTSLQSFYYFIFGVCLTLYGIILFSKKESGNTGNQSNSGKDAPMKRIYLNLFFIDRTEFIHNIVRTKIPRSRPLIRALAKRAAARLLKDGIVTKVSQGLCKSISQQMERMGLKCSVNLVYTQAAFAAVELSIHTLDLHQFFVFGAGSSKADKIIEIVNRYSFPALTEFAKRFLVGVVAGKLIVQLPNTIKEKLYIKMSTAIEVVACNEEDQGPFFVQMISQLNEGNKESSGSTVKEAASKDSKDVLSPGKNRLKDSDDDE